MHFYVKVFPEELREPFEVDSTFLFHKNIVEAAHFSWFDATSNRLRVSLGIYTIPQDSNELDY